MELIIEAGVGPPIPSLEVVERKGRGHPDTLCDALAESVTSALSEEYVSRFGAVLHHNVDKVLLVGGTSRPAFGGGEIVEPVEVILAGRATHAVGEARIDVEAIALSAARACLESRVPRLGLENVRLSTRIRPGAVELVDIFLRQAESGIWLSNDTSIGVGYAPLSRLERAVLEVERELTAQGAIARRPERGEDMKIMGVRDDDVVRLTVADAFVGGALPDLAAYVSAKNTLREDVLVRAAEILGRAPTVTVNAGDAPERGQIYLTVSGTSAEAGDDGEAGRGNRGNGLITPMRPMTMESIAGKNPVSHVGKIYNVVATLIAESIVGLDGVSAAEVVLVSRIGAPVCEPQLVRARLWTDGADAGAFQAAAQAIAEAELGRTDVLAREIVEGQHVLF